MLLEQKSFSFEVKDVTEQGVFEGYASTFGNVDLGGDKVVRGAFKRTLEATKGKVPVLWQHRDAIGVGIEAHEDTKGLYVRGQLVMTVKQAQEARDLTAAGAIRSMSIGYRVPRDGWDMDGETRLLKDIDLLEYSSSRSAGESPCVDHRNEIGGNYTERDFEELLRDVGFSQREAKTIIGHGFRALKGQRDVAPGDAAKSAVDQLRKNLLGGAVAKADVESLRAQLLG
jgi:HK97 family phage prohead protease